MVTTRLEILGYDNMPFAKDIPVVLTFNLADIREPDKRKATFSKTISLYGTNDVNLLFENIFEVNTQTLYFNKNKKTAVKYYVNEILNFKGDLQLIKIVLGADNEITYECSVIGAGGSLFVDIGDKYIVNNSDSSWDLDFSAYNHVYSRANQIAFRSTYYGTGLGVLYPLIDNGTNGGYDNVFNTENFIPCLHLYEYIKKIIEKTGRTFTSSILSSAEFKKYLVYPNINTLSLTNAQLNNKQLYVGLTSSQSLTLNLLSQVNYTDRTTAPFFDIGSQDFGTYIKINESGYYNICAHSVFTYNFTHTNPNTAYTVTIQNGGGVDISTITSILQSTDAGVTWTNITNVSGSIISGYGTGKYDINTVYSGTSEVTTGQIYVNAGTRFKVYAKQISDPIVDYYDIFGGLIVTGSETNYHKLKGTTAGSSFYALATVKTIIPGNTLSMQTALPTKIKQKDLLKSVVQALNLYIDIDPNDDKNLIIESFDTFYNTTTPVNYEGRTDLDKEQTINPNLLEGKRYIYTYTEDKDYWNDLYKSNNNEVFGTERIDIDNDFIKTDKENKIIFSPTPNAANYGLGIAHPRIYKIESNVKKTIVPNIRWLVCGGVKQSQNPITYKELGQSDLVSTDYLYAGHTDDPMNPTIDLNFGLPKEVFYTYPNAYFTNNNLYNRFHKYYLDTLTGRDSKIMTKYLWLTPKDINVFNFRNRIFVDGAYWIVNKISNYNPLMEQSTLCELVKLEKSNVFTPSSTLTATWGGGSGGSTLTQRLNSSLSVGTNIQNQAENSLAVGTNISIPSSARNINIIGSNISVPDNADGLNIFNNQGYSRILNAKGACKLTSVDYNVKAWDDSVLVTTGPTNITVTLGYGTIDYIQEDIAYAYSTVDIAYFITKIVTIKKVDSGAGNVIIDGYGALIDGSATISLTTQYQSVTLQWDGTNWNII